MSLQSLLKIRQGEGQRVLWMFVLLFLLVGAFITGRIIRDSLFLELPNVRDKLPLVYVAISITIALLTTVVTRINEHVNRTTFMTVAILLMCATLVASHFFVSNPPEWFPWAFYVWVDAFGSVMVLQFWTFANEIFNSREAKRLFALIGGGGVIANIAFGLGIGQLANRLGLDFMLDAFAGSLLLALGALVFARRSQPADTTAKTPEKSDRERKTKAPVLESRYLKLIAATTLCTFLVTTLGDFEFKLIVGETITNRDERAAFFGTFYGVTGALSAFVQFFLTNRILERLGILPALLALPVALFTGGVAIVISPVLWAGTLLKGGENTLRYTINDATTQLLYLPIAKQARARAKALVDGVLKPLAIGLAGLALFLLSKQLGHFQVGVALVSLTSLWVVLLVLLRGEYLKTLLLTLKQRRLDFEGVGAQNADEGTIRTFTTTLKSGEPEEILTVLDLLTHTHIQNAEQLVLPLLKHADNDVQVAALNYLAARGRPDMAPKVAATFNDDSELVRAAAISAYCVLAKDDAAAALEGFLDDPSLLIRGATVAGLIKNGGIEGVLTAADQLKSMIDDPNPRMRERAAWVLGEIGATGFYRPLIDLLRDSDTRVQLTAVESCARLRSPKLIEPLLQLLREGKAAPPPIIEALCAYGPEVETQMLKLFRDTAQPLQFREHMTRILMRIGGQPSVRTLLGELRLASDRLRTQSMNAALRIVRLKPETNLRPETLERCLQRELEGYLQALIVEQELGTSSELLLTDLRTRCEDGLIRVFYALSLLYPTSSLELVLANLQSQDANLRANALEVIDNVLTNEHKAKLIPLADDQLLPKAIRDGVPGLDVIHHEREDWLRELMSDPDPWTVVAALHAAAIARLQDLTPTMKALLNHESSWVRETSLFALKYVTAEGEVYSMAAKLIGDNVERVRRYGEHVLAELTMISNVEKVLFLKKIDLFRRIRGEDLARIADIAEEISYDAAERVFAEGDGGDALYLIVNGKVKVHKSEVQLAELGERQCFGEISILDSEPRSASVTALSPILLLKIRREDFGDIMQQKPEIAQGVIKVLCGRLRSANKR